MPVIVLTLFNLKKGYINPHFFYRSNAKEELANLEDVQEHDLKGAASLFSLKNGNHSG